MRFLLSPLLFLAAATAFANDSLLNGPVTLKLFPEYSKPAEPAAPALPVQEEPTEWWVELSINLNFDFPQDDDVSSGGTEYRTAFAPGVGAELQFALAKLVGTRSDWFDYSLLVRPYLGAAIHLFEGSDFRHRPTNQQVSLGELYIYTLHGGVLLGAGNLPDGSGPGVFLYMNLQAGIALMTSVEMTSPNLFAGTRDFTKESSSIYYGTGLGVRVHIATVSLNVEAGFRNYGRPQNDSAANPVTADEGQFTTIYILAGLTFEF